MQLHREIIQALRLRKRRLILSHQYRKRWSGLRSRVGEVVQDIYTTIMRGQLGQHRCSHVGHLVRLTPESCRLWTMSRFGTAEQPLESHVEHLRRVPHLGHLLERQTQDADLLVRRGRQVLDLPRVKEG